jgi:hypothetical protein
MSGNSGSQGRASGFAPSDGPRYSRENFNRDGYEQALSDFREVLNRADASAPTTAAELYELERLVGKYPSQAREFLDGLDGPPTAAAP